MYIAQFFYIIAALRASFDDVAAAQKASMGRLTKADKSTILRWHNIYRKMVKRGKMGRQPRGAVGPLV
uniref:Sperm-lysin n=1 Tax=Romanomermis culicivorax TaxID=13658 RepID=A0A915I4H2_ROMCU